MPKLNLFFWINLETLKPMQGISKIVYLVEAKPTFVISVEITMKIHKIPITDLEVYI